MNAISRFGVGSIAHRIMSLSAFPNDEIVVEETIAGSDLVTVRVKFRGVHGGPFTGISATGLKESADLIIIYRVLKGRIVEQSFAPCQNRRWP